jgi:hypothetical protein
MKVTRAIIIGALLFLCLYSSPCQGAPLFGDLPDNHWAHDAVANLAAKGLIEGYPDGTFKGDRAATRWEMAMVLARFLAKNDQEHATFATKAELEEQRALVKEYLDELAALGVRVSNLEEQENHLDKRVSELERIRFYGSIQSIFITQGVGGDIPGFGCMQLPGVDWSNGRLVTSGSGMSALTKLGVEAKISDEIRTGSEFAAYAATGDPGVNQYWGVVPPYLSNPFLAAGVYDGLGGIEPHNNAPWTRMTLDNFWMRHQPSGTRLIVGSFNPEQIEKTILDGTKNPNIHQPYTLPFYGATVGSYKKDRLLSWEAAYARLPQGSGGYQNYESWTAAGNLSFNFDKGKVSLNFLRALNEAFSFGYSQGPGIIPIPQGKAWLDTRRNILRSFVGPQSQNNYGISAYINLSKEIKFEGQAAWSDYNPDKSGKNFNTTSSGSLGRVGLAGNFKERLFLTLDYISVSAAFDPFLLRYETLPNIPIFLPYSTYYSNYWQLHDSQNYPSNRQGPRFSGTYKWTDTELTASWGSLEQVSPSTPAQIQTVGTVEPIFPTLQGRGSERGRLNSFGIGLSHTFPCKLNAYLNYYNYNILRSSGVIFDGVNFAENIYNAGLSLPVARNVTLFGNYTTLTLKGNAGLANQDFKQDIPTLGANYNFAENSSIALTYRLYNFENYAVRNSNWRGNQSMMEYKMSF